MISRILKIIATKLAQILRTPSLGSELSPFDEQVLNLCLSSNRRSNLKVLEVGSWVGLGSTQIFGQCAAELHCVDTWEGNQISTHDAVLSDSDPFDLFTKNTMAFDEKIIVHRGLSHDVMRRLPKNYFDLIFIDADHRYEESKVTWNLLSRC